MTVSFHKSTVTLGVKKQSPISLKKNEAKLQTSNAIICWVEVKSNSPFPAANATTFRILKF